MEGEEGATRLWQWTGGRVWGRECAGARVRAAVATARGSGSGGQRAWVCVWGGVPGSLEPRAGAALDGLGGVGQRHSALAPKAGSVCRVTWSSHLQTEGVASAFSEPVSSSAKGTVISDT